MSGRLSRILFRIICIGFSLTLLVGALMGSIELAALNEELTALEQELTELKTITVSYRRSMNPA